MSEISKEEYNKFCKELDLLILRPDGELSPDELNRISFLVDLIRDYELALHGPAKSSQLFEIVNKAAKELNVPFDGISDYLGLDHVEYCDFVMGEKEPTYTFLKLLHEKLKIPGDVLLELQ